MSSIHFCRRTPKLNSLSWSSCRRPEQDPESLPPAQIARRPIEVASGVGLSALRLERCGRCSHLPHCKLRSDAGVRGQDLAEVVVTEARLAVLRRVEEGEQRTELRCGATAEVVRRSWNEGTSLLPQARRSRPGRRVERIEGRSHRRVHAAGARARVRRVRDMTLARGVRGELDPRQVGLESRPAYCADPLNTGLVNMMGVGWNSAS